MVDKQVTKQERIETTIVVHLSASYLFFRKIALISFIIHDFLVICQKLCTFVGEMLFSKSE